MGRTGHCRQHILDSGIGVLSCKGYNGTGVKEIVDAAGVPKGSFYNHFASKEAFVVEALEKLASENLKTIESYFLLGDPSPKKRLFDFFEAKYECQKEHEFKTGCLFGNLCLEMSDENEAIRNVTSNVMCSVVKLIAECLQQAQNASELSKEYDTKELAEFIHCAWEGTMMRMKGRRDSGVYKVFRNQLDRFFD